ncbi:MAG: glycoside hydrolase family 9 protein [Saprospiraceae bacterium]|nr:glycoside hydrolase family 9 protein [Saprospiraceae bacterium]
MKTRLIVLFLFISALTPLLAGPGTTTPYIKIDQFGYLCNSKKVAVIVDPQTGYNSAESFNPGAGANQYQVRRWTDDVPVFTSTLQIWGGGAIHTQSGDRGWWFDFSDVTTPGSYYVYDLTNNVGSYRFEIGTNVYDDVLKHAMRTYFYQRIGIAKTSAHSDPKWTDGPWYTGANQDGAARSRWDKTNPATARDLSGGWFDAGDPNKYTTFAQDVIIDLLEAYRMNPGVFADNYNIPESGNGLPDILDEVKWELDFFKKMQDGTGTNGFFLKVGVDNYNSVSPPSLDTRARYYVPECTSGTLSGCAMFAIGGVVYSSLADPAMKAYGADLIARAEAAWARAVVTTNNFTTFETTCDDQNITSGDADRNAEQQKQSAFIAAVYLYEATGSNTYKTFVENNYMTTEPYASWWWGPYYNGAHLAMLRYASLSGVTSSVANNIRTQKAGQNGVLSINDYDAKKDLYRSYMPDPQYHWGSNTVKGSAGNNNLDFITFNLNPASHDLYREVAEEYLHYFHGQNPQGMVYLSNMYAYGAENCANEIYHMWFDNGTDWDHAINSPKGPAPGYVTGGANKDFSVGSISPPAGQPAQKAYKDWNAGYPDNSWEITEPAIYSQASYIRLLSRVMALNANCSVTSVHGQNDMETGIRKLSVSPNPSAGSTTVSFELEKFDEDALLQLFDRATGTLVQEQRIAVMFGKNALQIDLSGHPAGLYLLQLTVGKDRQSTGVVLQR